MIMSVAESGADGAVSQVERWVGVAEKESCGAVFYCLFVL